MFSNVILEFMNRYKNQIVAIKIVHGGETPEEIAKREARFAREVAMLSRVQHKNLVKVVFIAILFHCSRFQHLGLVVN
jgi:hypothetical protein